MVTDETGKGVSGWATADRTQTFMMRRHCDTFIVLCYLFLYHHDFSLPRQLWIAGCYWKWILWCDLQSTTENEWFGMCYWWHFCVPRLTTVSCRYSHARNSTLRGWASEIGSRLLQKYVSWPTHVTSSLIDSNECIEIFSRTFITTTLYDTMTDKLT